jgi:nickel/cobalt transporter (NicO) family protein
VTAQIAGGAAPVAQLATATAGGAGHAHAHDHDHAPRSRWASVKAQLGGGHDHAHDGEHGGHGHSHDIPDDMSMRGLVAVGVSGGLLPCPSALVVLLAAISLHRVGFGLALVLAFSVGLALTITAIGLVAVLAKRAFARVNFENRLVSLLPALSAVVILVAGLAMTIHAIPTLQL